MAAARADLQDLRTADAFLRKPSRELDEAVVHARIDRNIREDRIDVDPRGEFGNETSVEDVAAAEASAQVDRLEIARKSFRSARRHRRGRRREFADLEKLGATTDWTEGNFAYHRAAPSQPDQAPPTFAIAVVTLRAAASLAVEFGAEDILKKHLVFSAQIFSVHFRALEFAHLLK